MRDGEPLGGERTVPFGGDEPEKPEPLAGMPMQTVDDRGVSGQTDQVADAPAGAGSLSPTNNPDEMTPQRAGDSNEPA